MTRLDELKRAVEITDMRIQELKNVSRLLLVDILKEMIKEAEFEYYCRHGNFPGGN